MTDRKRDDELTADDRHSRLDQQHDREQQARDRVEKERPPLPVPSPQPPRGTDEVTGEHELPFASHEYVKQKQAAAFAEAVVAKGRSLVATIVASLAVILSVLLALDSRAQSKVDGGLAPYDQRLTKVESKVESIDQRQQQSALEQVRTNVMLENLSRRLGTEVPPPAPKVILPDGGTP